jgi:hypothetical protein
MTLKTVLVALTAASAAFVTPLANADTAPGPT